jgi:7-cyano-7-deazaguanine synthase
MKDAVVLLSGGQDSTTCLYWAKRALGELHCIGFDYGQTHVAELEQAELIATAAGATYDLVSIKGLLSGSSLTDPSIDHASKHSNDLPASFTAGRNILMLTIAAQIAASKGISDIVAGFCQTDYAGYPDCRRVTIDSMQTTLSLGMGAGDFRIYTPLMYLTKAETWKMAKDLDIMDVIINDTITDYNAAKQVNEWGMGDINNPATKLRADGYFEAKEKGWI